MRFSSGSTSDSSQLTMDSMIAAQIADHQKSVTCSPQPVVVSVIHDVIHSINALMTMWTSPSVRMYSGIATNCTIGLMNALTTPKISGDHEDDADSA